MMHILHLVCNMRVLHLLWQIFKKKKKHAQLVHSYSLSNTDDCVETKREEESNTTQKRAQNKKKTNCEDMVEIRTET